MILCDPGRVKGRDRGSGGECLSSLSCHLYFHLAECRVFEYYVLCVRPGLTMEDGKIEIALFGLEPIICFFVIASLRLIVSGQFY